MVSMWLIFCIIITTAYRSSLVAHLTVERREAPIDSFEELLEAQGWSWGMDDSFGALYSYIEASNDPLARGIKEKLQVIMP